MVADGRSHLLLVRGAFQESSGIITRINRNGSVDRSFGDEGTVDLGGEGALVDPSGKILLATTSHLEEGMHVDTRARVTRLLPTGRLDRSFGVDGSTDIDFGNHYDYAETIALAANGDILVGGIRVDRASNYESDNAIVVARLRPNGSIDRSFGKSGVSIVVPAGGEIGPFDIKATPSGGAVIEAGNTDEVFFCKVTANGSFDSHFGTGGFLDLKELRSGPRHHEALGAAGEFAVLPSGKLLVAATGYPTRNRHRVVAIRLLPAGRVDRSFGNDGFALAKGEAETSARGATLLPGGAFAIATTFTRGPSGEADFGAIAFSSEGKIERTFGRHGICRARLSRRQEATEAINVGGRAVVVGNDELSPERWLLDCPAV